MTIATRLALSALCLLVTVVVWPFLWELNLALHPHVPWSAVPIVALATYVLVRVPTHSPVTPKTDNIRKAAIVLIAGTAVATAQVGAYLAYSAVLHGPRLTLGYLTALSWVVAVAFCAADSLISGVMEEFVFRGLLQPAFERSLGRWTAIGATTLLFVASHSFKPEFAHLAPHLALLSITYGYMASRTRSFVLVAIAHSVHNALAYQVSFAADRIDISALPDGTPLAAALGVVSLITMVIAVAAITRYWPQAHAPSGFS